MCEKTPRVTCDVCRTINLAKHAKIPKPDMEMYEKGYPVPTECVNTQATEVPLHPTCIKVCTKEEYKLRNTKPIVARGPYYAHGKLMYATKAGVLISSIYFTYSQGIWGDQQQVVECLRRWSEYIRSLNTRRPPTFDNQGKVCKKETVESIVAPVYDLYKKMVTTCFAGVVKVPVLIKCAYIDYLRELDRKHAELVKERQIRKRS